MPLVAFEINSEICEYVFEKFSKHYAGKLAFGHYTKKGVTRFYIESPPKTQEELLRHIKHLEQREAQ